MADRPSDLPRWATDAGSRVEPPEGKKDEGWQEGEKPPAGFFNWLFGLAFDWLAWIQERTFAAGSRLGVTGLQSNGPITASMAGALPLAPAIEGIGQSTPGVRGISGSSAPGVHGLGTSPSVGAVGVRGEGAVGVVGQGVQQSVGFGAPGVKGIGAGPAPGVEGKGGTDAPGVKGEANGEGPGVLGEASAEAPGVLGEGSANAPGVLGVSGGGPGVEGRAAAANVAAVHGETSHNEGFAVRARGWHEASQAPIGTGLVASGTKGVVGSGTFIGVQAEGIMGGIPLVVAAQAQPTVDPPQVPKGAIYFDNASNTLKVFDGTLWRTVQTT